MAEEEEGGEDKLGGSPALQPADLPETQAGEGGDIGKEEDGVVRHEPAGPDHSEDRHAGEHRSEQDAAPSLEGEEQAQKGGSEHPQRVALGEGTPEVVQSGVGFQDLRVEFVVEGAAELFEVVEDSGDEEQEGEG